MNVLTPTSNYQILFRDVTYRTGLSLNAYVYSSPSFVKTGPHALTEIADGYYYFEQDFTTEGTYIVKIATETEVYRVHNMAKEASIVGLEDMLKATIKFDKTSNVLSFYQDAAMTQLIVEFQVNDTTTETTKTKL